MYFRLCTLSQEKTNCYSLTATPKECHRMHYLVKCTNFWSFFHFFHAYWVPIRNTDELRKCCDMDWILAERGGLDDAVDQWRKDWKHVSVQKVATLNICCNVACLTFHLPHITTGSFQSHQCQPTISFFQGHQRVEECNIPWVRWKSSAFYKVVWWHFSGVLGKEIAVCFLVR